MPNLEILSLSINDIAILKPLQHCTNLRVLFLRQNLVADFEEIRYLQPLTALKTLSLLDNPITEQPGYREAILSMLPQLTKLDDQLVGGGGRSAPVKTNRSHQSLPIGSQPPVATVDPEDERRGRAVQYRRVPERQAGGGKPEQAILSAVLSLLPELGPESLSVVVQAIADQTRRS
jgi:Leucine-rich repeat (LRR) protein